jgi:MtfA peptidase
MGFRSQNLFRIGWWLRDVKASFYPREISINDIKLLERSFPYFENLTINHKKEFIQRLSRILSIKEFVARGGIEEVTSEMEILIGATIVMVTFGWKRVRLRHFNTILIYPNAYYSSITKSYHRGEVNPKYGIIVVSWSCFLEGMKDRNDGVNLGIHEIAHALKLENQIYYNGESEFFNPQAWNAYQQLVKSETALISTGNGSLFRESASINEHEFFAVALENFFERPTIFFNYHPQLYGVLVQLLRQDPRGWMK